MRHHGYMMDNFAGGFGVFSIIWTIMWIALIVGGIILVVYLVKRGSDRPNKGSANHAINILQERFARGEIDEIEYKEKKRVLKEE